jgi:hypothetical protein
MSGEDYSLARQQLPTSPTLELAASFFIKHIHIVNNSGSSTTVQVLDGNGSPFIPSMTLAPGGIINGVYPPGREVYMPNGLNWSAGVTGVWGFVQGEVQ